MNNNVTYGLTHLAIGVHDIERTRLFYQAVFGMEIMYYTDGFLQLTTPGCHDVLVFEEKDNAMTGSSGGIAHFGFRLKMPEDIRIMESRIMEAGGMIIEKGVFVPGSPYIFFNDPDGYLIETWYELEIGTQ